MRLLVTLPTYNESANVGRLVTSLLALRPDLEVLVVDDDSPDGTWRIVQERAATEPRLHLLHRTHERGRGTAGRDGFRWAVEHGAEMVVEMDADFSHHPRYIAAMLEEIKKGADLVIGSRLVAGGGEVGRGLIRPLVTRLANWYIRLLLWLPVRDCTSGYRVYRGSLLARIPWERVQAQGPEIVQETLLFARAQRAKIAEVPILFEERAAGQSTFNMRILRRSLLAMLRFRLRRFRVN
jgi:dolichol-phosphate mannosyltransferase